MLFFGKRLCNCGPRGQEHGAALTLGAVRVALCVATALTTAAWRAQEMSEEEEEEVEEQEEAPEAQVEEGAVAPEGDGDTAAAAEAVAAAEAAAEPAVDGEPEPEPEPAGAHRRSLVLCQCSRFLSSREAAVTTARLVMLSSWRNMPAGIAYRKGVLCQGLSGPGAPSGSAAQWQPAKVPHWVRRATGAQAAWPGCWHRPDAAVGDHRPGSQGADCRSGDTRAAGRRDAHPGSLVPK